MAVQKKKVPAPPSTRAQKPKPKLLDSSAAPRTPTTATKTAHKVTEEEFYAKEYWNGDSRDGVLVNGDGYHYYRMTKSGKILEAYEYYETEDGQECVCPLPEMMQIHWLEDLGFEDFDALDIIKEFEFMSVKEKLDGASSD
jgi:hypothetical protein